MKVYISALLVIFNIFLFSIIYKQNSSVVLKNFPIEKLRKTASYNQIYLFFVFSINNCLPCLEIINDLNQLPKKYKVIGLIPESELPNEKAVREITNAQFELRSLKSFKRYIPNYAPTLYAINCTGDILFVLPAVPGLSAYFRQFFDSFVLRASSLIEIP